MKQTNDFSDFVKNISSVKNKKILLGIVTKSNKDQRDLVEKAKTIQLIKNRINKEYKKYHNSPVDFMQTAAIKIYRNLKENNLLK